CRAAGARPVQLRRAARGIRSDAGVHKSEHGSTEAGADQTRTVHPALRAQCIGQDVELFGRNVEVLAKRCVRRVDDRPAPREVAGPERRDESADALVLADDVPDAARESRVLRGEALDVLERGVAERNDAETPGGVVALCAP